MDRRIGALLAVLAWLTLPDLDALVDGEDETSSETRGRTFERRLVARCRQWREHGRDREENREASNLTHDDGQWADDLPPENGLR